MDKIIAGLELIAVIGVFITFWRVLMFFASFSSLIFVANEHGRETFWKNLLTGGFVSLWRVWRHQENARARKVFVRNVALAAVSFAVTMGTFLLAVQLEEKQCLVGMTRISADGTVEPVCDPFG